MLWIGECRHDPPTVQGNGQVKQIGVRWPVAWADDWCGKWQKGSGPAPYTTTKEE